MDFDVTQRERQQERERELGDRSFTLRGEKFTYVANSRFDVIKRVAALGQESDGSMIVDTLAGATVELIEDKDDAHERWFKLCEQTEFPITFADLNDIATWLIEQQTGRPTQAPSSSQDGPGANGTSLTDTSSSTPVAASTS